MMKKSIIGIISGFIAVTALFCAAIIKDRR